MLCNIVIFVSDEMFTYKSHVSVQVCDGPSGQPRVGKYTGGECLRVDGSVSVLAQVRGWSIPGTHVLVNSVLQALASSCPTFYCWLEDTLAREIRHGG